MYTIYNVLPEDRGILSDAHGSMERGGGSKARLPLRRFPEVIGISVVPSGSRALVFHLPTVCLFTHTIPLLRNTRSADTPPDYKYFLTKKITENLRGEEKENRGKQPPPPSLLLFPPCVIFIRDERDERNRRFRARARTTLGRDRGRERYPK